jgi:uncharacterized membrane protein YfcA
LPCDATGTWTKRVGEPAQALIILLFGVIAALYATVGQSGGTAFVAVMALMAQPPHEIRPMSLALNIVAASYATWRLHRSGAINWTAFRTLIPASLPAAFAGGAIILPERLYAVSTAALLLVAALLMVVRGGADHVADRHVAKIWMALAGLAVGFLSGLTGIGGGVFLTPLLIALGWLAPRRAAALAAPFILANSAFGLAGVLYAGQSIPSTFIVYAPAVVIGAMVGTAIGLRWLSQASTRLILAGILTVAGVRLLAL